MAYPCWIGVLEMEMCSRLEIFKFSHCVLFNHGSGQTSGSFLEQLSTSLVDCRAGLTLIFIFQDFWSHFRPFTSLLPALCSLCLFTLYGCFLHDFSTRVGFMSGRGFILYQMGNIVKGFAVFQRRRSLLFGNRLSAHCSACCSRHSDK